jgi:hypothetical protein
MDAPLLTSNSDAVNNATWLLGERNEIFILVELSIFSYVFAHTYRFAGEQARISFSVNAYGGIVARVDWGVND